MGLFSALLGLEKNRDSRCYRCRRRIEDDENAYQIDGHIFCEECAEDEMFWEELELLDDIDDEDF